MDDVFRGPLQGECQATNINRELQGRDRLPIYKTSISTNKPYDVMARD